MNGPKYLAPSITEPIPSRFRVRSAERLWTPWRAKCRRTSCFERCWAHPKRAGASSKYEPIILS
eukprot:671808-Pyramimonas_sp.AAC.1